MQRASRFVSSNAGAKAKFRIDFDPHRFNLLTNSPSFESGFINKNRTEARFHTQTATSRRISGRNDTGSDSKLWEFETLL